MAESLTKEETPAIVWFRDDLRLSDHPALEYATSNSHPILAIYIYPDENAITREIGSAQKWFLHHALENLKVDIEKLGGRLDIFKGNPEQIIDRLCKETGSKLVTWNRRVGEKEIAVDTAIKSKLSAANIEVKSFLGNLLHEPFKIKTGAQGPYRVYTPFWRRLEAEGDPRAPLPRPSAIQQTATVSDAIELPELDLLPNKPNWALNWEDQWHPSEAGAANALKDYLDNGLEGYDGGRDFPAKPNCSRLSPFFRFGLISPFQVWSVIKSLQDRAETKANDSVKFLKQLGWRDFSHHLLFHYPDLHHVNFSKKFDRFPWRDDFEDDLKAWQKGQTGYPIVDAGMRELWQTGYMHNRVRMVVGSFLVKHLLIHWHHGEKWFWDTLVDADPANNTASWQWIAGCGADAAPYFRVFNPILQGQKFDAEGEYVRRFIPELKALPKKYIHCPWETPKDILEHCNIALGKDYPLPIVEHTLGRNRALDAFKQLKEYDI